MASGLLDHRWLSSERHLHLGAHLPGPSAGECR